jgi:diguanylate cyclase (GGDEF)-like protein
MDRPVTPSALLSNDAASPATGAGNDPSTQWQTLLVDAHYQQSPLVVMSGLALSALMCRVLWASAPQKLLLIWLAAIQTLMLLRLTATMFYLKGQGRTRWSLQRWLVVTHVQAILSGLSWGGIGLFYPWTDDILGRTAIVVTLMGVCAGSAALVGSVRGTLPTFGLLAIGPLALMMAMQGGTGHLYMATALLYYVYIVMVKGPSRIAHVMKALHAGQIAREVLVGRLEDAERMGQMGHIVWDHEARRATLSAEARRQLDLSEEHLSNAHMIWQRVIPEERERVIQLCRDAIGQQQPELRFDTRIRGPIGLRDLRVVQRFVYDATDGRILRTMTTTQDITELKTTQRELHDLAFHDMLTGLANRAGFQHRLHERTVHAVLMIDLDHFKNVNDTLGHSCGDRLLVAAADRLVTCLRSDDMVARLGGDEFAVLIHDELSAQQLERIAQRIVEALSAPYHIDGHDIVVSASIGIARHLGTDIAPDTLMRQADTALFAAKARGRSRHEFHSEAMSERARERVALEADLRRAVSEQQFSVHYQPKVDLRDVSIIGAEALLRWRHPERGLVPPDHFIPVAEDCGLIVPIGEWVLRQSCAAAVRWNTGRPGRRCASPSTCRRASSSATT